MQDSTSQHSNNSYSARAAQFFIGKRRLMLVLSALLCLATSTGLLRTSFDTSLTALLTQSDPYLVEYDRLQEIFPDSVDVNFIFLAEEGSTVFTADLTNAIEQLQNSYTDIPTANRVSSILNYTSPETRRRLFTKRLDSYSEDEFSVLAKTAIADRLLTANLLARDASLTFAIISTTVSDSDAELRMEMADAIVSLRDSLRRDHPGVGIYANSEVLFEQNSQQAMLSDLITLMPLIILACVLAICYCFSSVRVGVCILIHVLFTILCTVGSLGYLGFAFNSISIIAPLVVVIVAVANSVHIISIYRQSLHRGKNKKDAMNESITNNFQPISLAALTTAIGFSSLNMCSSPAIQDFGRIVAIGIIFAYLLTLTLLPALLIRFTRITTFASGSKPFLQGPLEQLCHFTRKNDKVIFISCTVLALVTFAMLPLNQTDFNRLDFVANDSDIKQFYDEVGDRMNRGPSLTYAIDVKSLNGVTEPELLERVDSFNLWLQQQPNIESSASVVDVIKTVNQVQHQNDPEYYRIPEDSNRVSNNLLAYALVQNNDFPLFSFVDQDFSLLNIFINAVPISNQQLIDLDVKITQKFEQDFPDLELLHGSGILLFARMDELVTVELMQGYSISLILITLSLMVGLRSVYFGILSVLPNLLPATIVFGFWGLLVGQLDPFVMMLFSISIGLVVDDTVHILSHYLQERRAGSNKTLAIDHAIRTAGPALTITTLVLALGTTFLIAAETLYFQQAAKLLVPIVVVALALDLLYLPTILRRFDKQPSDDDFAEAVTS